MNLDIVIPGLLWQDIGDIEYIYKHAKTTQFNQLIKKANIDYLSLNYSDFLYGAFLPEIDKIGLANYLAQKYHLNKKHQYFLIVEPTNLIVDRDRLLISEPELLQLNIKEQETIINDINQHFGNDFTFYYISDSLWLLGHSLPNLNQNIFYPTIDIIGENIDDFLPNGQHSILYTKLINEIQMILHNHKVNTERKYKGYLTINSIWIWDKYFENKIIYTKNKIIYTNNKALLNSNNPHIKNLNNKFEQSLYDNVILLVDNLYYPNRYRNSSEYLDILEQLDIKLALVLNSRMGHTIKTLNIYVPNTKQTIKITLNNLTKYKFWKNNNFTKLAAMQ